MLKFIFIYVILNFGLKATFTIWVCETKFSVYLKERKSNDFHKLFSTDYLGMLMYVVKSFLVNNISSAMLEFVLIVFNHENLSSTKTLACVYCFISSKFDHIVVLFMYVHVKY